MSLQDYFDRCQRFDWYFDFSDDGAVWRRQHSIHEKLIAESMGNPEKKKIYDAWRSYMFSGTSFKTEKSPKPVRP